MESVIRVAIEDVLSGLGISEADFVVEHPSDLDHGDYSCNVAMVAAKKIGKNPRELAEEIVSKLEGQIEYVEKIEVAGPGFVNFYLVRDFFVRDINRIIELGGDWGKNNDWEGKTVIVEYTDPNPFKELHIGHLVPNALGESLARLFMFANANTKRVTFQGDVGMHVAKAIWGLQKNGITNDSEITAQDLGNAYVLGAEAFESNEEHKTEIKNLNKKIYSRDDEDINKLYDAGKKVSLDYFEVAYKKLGSEFDKNFFESQTGPAGLEIVQAHIGDVFQESEGAIIFKGEDHGLHTRVFVNNEGLPTYETKDVGLVKCKNDWEPFDLAITVTDTAQAEYFKVTTKASELIQPELAGKIELVANGRLRLSEGKMSSRTGNVIPALQFIDDIQKSAIQKMEESNGNKDWDQYAELPTDIAIGAIKYTILKIATGKDIVFDLQKSVSFEGDSGPYLQYTHARINSVLEKAADSGIEGSVKNVPDKPYELEKILYRFEEVVREATLEREPHKVVNYLTELAGVFNSFYSQEKIADPNDEFAPYKVLVSLAVRQTLKNGLWLLGIKAPERM